MPTARLTSGQRSPTITEPGTAATVSRPLRVATFLAPDLFPLYAFLTRRLGERLSIATELFVGTSYQEMLTGADAGFLCGLAYVELAAQESLLEPLAAPILQGNRYGGRPIYFSDVIVHRDSPFQRFTDLRGCSWSYNEPLSHSGYGITRYHLVQLGETRGFFGRVVEAGWHERSLRLVCDGEIDASAIDSQVLAIALRQQPELAARLRVIDSLGPSTIQPFVASRQLPASLRAAMQAVLLEVGADPAARAILAHALVDGFTPVDDATYNDLRQMREACAAADFLTLR